MEECPGKGLHWGGDKRFSPIASLFETTVQLSDLDRQTCKGIPLDNFAQKMGGACTYGRLATAKMALEAALSGKFPVVCDFAENDTPIFASDLDELMRQVDKHIRDAHDYYAKYKNFPVHLD